MANPAQDDSQQRAELRIAFLKHLPKRLDQVCRRGRRFCQDGWDINGLSLLHDDVQRMAGVAGRYGALEASQQLLPFILIGLVVLVVAVWLIAKANRKTTVIDDGSIKQDVLDEGAERARRNQALIDAAPAAVKPAPAAVKPAPAPEPVPAPAGPVPAPAPAPSPAPAPDAPAAADDLARIKGVGPKLVALLGELGVTSYAQIAAWTDADVERIDAQLGRFAGRITRDQWIEQAKMLSAGDEAGFTERFGRNG